MSNMGYCRFENTSRDLADCKNALERMINDKDRSLSEDELDSAKKLASDCLTIVKMLTEYADDSSGQDDPDVLADALDNLNEECKASQ